MIRVCLLLLALAHPLRAEVFPAWYDVTGVAADDVLNIRAAPDAGSEVIGTLAPDANGVEVVAVQGGWAVVNTDEGAGFASMQFLRRASGLDWNLLKSPLACQGTEPFWSLQIDPANWAARFQAPEDQTARALPITTTWPGLPWAEAAAVELSEGVLVLTPAECSDGMSDRHFGIATDLFATETGKGGRLSGCCRLVGP